MKHASRGLRAPLLVALATTALLALAGCGEDETTADTPGASATPSSTQEDSREAASFSIEDAWIKAIDPASTEMPMTAAFGVLTNTGSSDITVVSASSDVSPTVELHETVESDGAMAMQPKDGGFVIPAGGTHELTPGGDHIMFMDVTRALEPGESVTITLTLGDGSTVEVDAVVKEFSGADEEYQHGDSEQMGESDMGGMEHSE